MWSDLSHFIPALHSAIGLLSREFLRVLKKHYQRMGSLSHKDEAGSGAAEREGKGLHDNEPRVSRGKPMHFDISARRAQQMTDAEL